MPPKFKRGDSVLHKPSARHYTISHVVPFTLEIGQEVNVQEIGLGKCRVTGKYKESVMLEPLKDWRNNSDYWRKVTQVDKPPGIPVPSYELIGQEGEPPFWALESTLEKDTVRELSQAATNAWAHC